MTDEQIIEQRCGHGHGPLIELPDRGLRCPACFPEMFIDEIKRLRRIDNLRTWLTRQLDYETDQMDKHGPPPPDGEGEWSFHYGMSDAYRLALREFDKLTTKASYDRRTGMA